MISTANSKIVQVCAASGTIKVWKAQNVVRILRSRNKKFRLSFSIFHTLAPSSFSRSGSSYFRKALVSKESVTLRRNDTRKFDVNRV